MANLIRVAIAWDFVLQSYVNLWILCYSVIGEEWSYIMLLTIWGGSSTCYSTVALGGGGLWYSAFPEKD